MKKSPRKLRLHRDTLVRLDPRTVAKAFGGDQDLENKTSCTYACACPTGCTEDQPCIDGGLM